MYYFDVLAGFFFWGGGKGGERVRLFEAIAVSCPLVPVVLVIDWVLRQGHSGRVASVHSHVKGYLTFSSPTCKGSPDLEVTQL